MAFSLFQTPPKISVACYQGETSYRRRARTSEAAFSLDFSDILIALGDDLRWVLTKHPTLYLREQGQTWNLFPPGIPIHLTSFKQHHGRRYAFICPVSGLRARKLYGFVTPAGFVVGSAKGLGLSYPSQAMHKTPALDAAIASWRLKVNPIVAARASEREHERLNRAVKKFAKG